jgi:hypothetical protein
MTPMFRQGSPPCRNLIILELQALLADCHKALNISKLIRQQADSSKAIFIADRIYCNTAKS